LAEEKDQCAAFQKNKKRRKTHSVTYTNHNIQCTSYIPIQKVSYMCDYKCYKGKDDLNMEDMLYNWTKESKEKCV